MTLITTSRQPAASHRWERLSKKQKLKVMLGKRRSRQGFKTIIKPSKEAQKRHLVAMAEVIKNNWTKTAY